MAMPNSVTKLDTKRGHTAKSRSGENFQRMEEIRTRLKMNKNEFSIALGYVTGGGYPDGKVDTVPLGGSPQTARIMDRDYILVPVKK